MAWANNGGTGCDFKSACFKSSGTVEIEKLNKATTSRPNMKGTSRLSPKVMYTFLGW